jgi:CheY-like chemotaxis protein
MQHGAFMEDRPRNRRKDSLRDILDALRAERAHQAEHSIAQLGDDGSPVRQLTEAPAGCRQYARDAFLAARLRDRVELAQAHEDQNLWGIVGSGKDLGEASRERRVLFHLEAATVRFITAGRSRLGNNAAFAVHRPERSAVSNPPPAQSPSIRILLVEDSADDMELIALALERVGLDVALECVETAAEFARALERAPDVVLCDFHLPRFGCREALEMLHAKPTHIPFIVVSRYIRDEEWEALRQSGADGLVRKDRLSDLASAITKAVAHRGSRSTRDSSAS